MKILRIAGIAVGGLLALLIVVSFFMPGRTNTRVELVIDAPPERIYPLLARLQAWPEWTAWGPEEIPDIQYRFEGPEEGVGAVMHWDSAQTNGTLTIESAEANRSVGYSITMENGNGAADGGFTLEPLEAGGTRVIWRDSSLIKGPPVLNRLMTPLLESMMDDAAAKGLQGIQARLSDG